MSVILQKNEGLGKPRRGARSALSMTALAITAFGLAACSSLNGSEMLPPQTPDRLQALALSQPPIEYALTLEEALARGFVYNVDFQTRRLRAFQSFDEVGLSQAEYLPRVMLNAGYTRRSNIQASVGQRVSDMDGGLPTDFFTATDQSRTYGSFVATWNLIDFGLSYLENEKHKLWAGNDYEASLVSCSSLAGTITSTYWRARAFERAQAKNEWLRWRVEVGLDVSRQRAEADPETRTAELLLQRELIDLFRWYDSIYVSLSQSKAELAGLINLPPGSEFELETSQTVSYLHALPSDGVELVKMAFANRPELRQRLLLDEINQISDRQDVLRLFPSLSVLFGGETDSNSFLLNNSFTNVGASISWNLFELARTSDRQRRQADRAAMLDIETQLIANAIASQVAMAVSEYQARDKTLEYAWRANTIQAEIADRMAALQERGEAPESHTVKEELLRELSIIRRDVDEAGHQAARIRVLNALGLGPDCSALPLSSGYAAVRSALTLRPTLALIHADTPA